MRAIAINCRVAVRRLAACSVLVLLSHCAWAATVTKCVHNVTELQNDLAAASSPTNANDHVLELLEGVYLAPSGGFIFNQITNHSLDIEGGFFSNIGSNGCDRQRLTATTTKLDGRGNQAIFTSSSSGVTSGNITFRYLTFQHAGGDVNALEVVMRHNAGTLRVENTLFTHNQTTYGSVYLDVPFGKVYFIDNALVGNVNGNVSKTNDGSTAAIYVGASPSVVAYINNNTIAGNTEPDGSPAPFGFDLSGSAGFDLANNIVWDGNDCDVFAGSSTQGSPPPAVTFDRDDIDHYCNVAPQTGSKTINKDPLFVDPAHDNYRLQRSSPAVDAGDNSPPGGIRAIDVEGTPRVVGVVDLGAYELDTIFADGFEL